MPNLKFTDIILSEGLLRSPDQTVARSEDNHEFILPEKGIDPQEVQTLKFIHLDKEGNYQSGVADEQLLEVLISRAEHFQSVLPCAENEIALHGLRAALRAWNYRSELRQKAKVEGTHESH